MSNAEIMTLPGSSVAWKPFRLSRTGIAVVGNPTFNEWMGAFEELTRTHGSMQWWLGDMLAIGEARYGEKYSQVVDATDYVTQSLTDMAWVARQVEISRRRENLSWSHHREIAPLEPAVGDRLLEAAELGKWSVSALRDAKRTYKKALANPAAPPDASLSNEVENDKEAAAQPSVSDEEENTPPPEPTEDEPTEGEVELAEVGFDLATEVQHQAAEIERLEAENQALAASDLGAEVRRWTQKYAQLEGRLRQELETSGEAKKQATYYGKILKKLAAVLGVDRYGEIEARVVALTSAERAA